MEKILTIGGAYRKASSFLADDFSAELLLRKLLKIDRTTFYLSLDQPFPLEKKLTWEAWLQRRRADEPIQYIVKEQEFYGRIFSVEPYVLIPRPETELLVEHVLAQADEIWGNQPLHLVDVGTGSGAIAVTLAAERPLWQITAIDYSKEALQIAKENAIRHGVDERICFMQGDFLAPMIREKRKIDLLVSNPPYIAEYEMAELEAQVRAYEPTLALVGGEDGLSAYRKILSQLKSAPLLSDKHLLAFEIGAKQASAVCKLVGSLSMKLEIDVAVDLAGYDRLVLAKYV